MKATVGSGIVVTLAILGIAGVALAQDFDSDNGRPQATAAADSAASPAEPTEAKTMVHYQTGLFMQFAGDPLLSGDQKWLVTLDLSLSSYNRHHAAWGFGLHAAIDEATGRFGPKLFWRTPLSKGGKGYFQISPGIYLVGDNDLGWPSSFLEAEFGYTNSIALVAALEYLSYGESKNGTGGGYDRTAGYVGLKLGNLPAIVATVGGLVVAATALANMDLSN